MCAAAAVERRQHCRYPLTTSAALYHEPSRKEYPGRCADISQGGAMLHLPAGVPIQVGHAVRLAVNNVDRPELAGLGEATLNAVVVRVQRQTLLSQGTIAVGVQFVQK